MFWCTSLTNWRLIKKQATPKLCVANSGFWFISPWLRVPFSHSSAVNGIVSLDIDILWIVCAARVCVCVRAINWFPVGFSHKIWYYATGKQKREPKTKCHNNSSNNRLSYCWKSTLCECVLCELFVHLSRNLLTACCFRLSVSWKYMKMAYALISLAALRSEPKFDV